MVQRRCEDVLEYWNRFKDVVRKHVDWIPVDEPDLSRHNLVNRFIGGLFQEVRDEN